MAIMKAEPQQIAAALDGSPELALSCTLQCKQVNGHRFFLLQDQLYAANLDGVREALGSTFRFEHESLRMMLANWLEMIDAKSGDTLMHIVLRLNGIEDVVKARCTVEFLGRGASFEVENCDGELPAMVDDAFKLAFLKELKPWNLAREEQQMERKREAAARRRMEAAKAQEQAESNVRANERERLAKLREFELAGGEAARAAREFHQKLNRALAKLDRREQRQAKENPAWRELVTDLRAIPTRVELWFHANVLTPLAAQNQSQS